MPGASAEVQDVLHAMAAVLTAVRGRLSAVCSSLPEEEPGLEGEESSPGLRSVVSCILTDSIDPAIRDLLSAAEQEPAASPSSATPLQSEAGEPDYDALWSRLDLNLSRLLAEREAERHEAEGLFRDLVSLNPAARRTAVEEARFHRPVVVDRLLEGVQAALPADPAAAEELAALAAAVARRLADPDEAMDGSARAACWLAHARRIGSDEAGAEQALSEATLQARYSAEQALLCRALGLLRWEQGKVDEAAALLERAAELWAGEELPHEEGACWVLRALLMTEEGKVRDALGMLRTGLPLLVDPWLTLYGGLALALGLAERGLAEKARTRRDVSMRLVHSTPPAAFHYARRLAGRIALSLGEQDKAEEMLEELRREAIARRWLPEAVVATLDLASLDMQRGRAGEAAEQRASALESAFGETEDLTGLLAALRGFPKQIPPGENLHEFTGSLGASFLRALRLRGVRSAPLPFT